MNYAQDLPFFDPDAPQLVGLSGGKDSTGLAVWLTANQGDRDLRFVHVRHGLRDDSLDAKAAQATANRLGRPFIEVPAAWDRVTKAGGPEDAARQARYAAFCALGRSLHAHVLYLGHTADDQAETVLLRLIRGTGPYGITGMSYFTQYQNLQVYRPLLHWSRADVRALAEGYPTVEDPTNTDMNQRRAFIRHQVMPLLAKARPDGQNPSAAILSFAELASEQNYLLEQLLKDREGPTWSFVHRIPYLALGSGALEHALIHRAYGQGVTRAIVGRIAALHLGERIDLPGGRWAARDQFGLIVGRKNVRWAVKADSPAPGPVRRSSPDTDPMAAYPMPWSIALSQDVHLDDLAIRLREPRDRAHKKIFTQFPKSLREQLPVLYTRSSNEVVAIGPIGLQEPHLHSAAMQWVKIWPELA